MSKDTTISAAEWLEIRARVADKLKTGGSEQRANTREHIAEQMLVSGYIDIEFIRDEIATEKSKIREQTAALRESKTAPADKEPTGHTR